MAKVQEILGRVRDNGHVYEGIYEGWYCPRCADFKTDAEAGDDNLCPIHETPLTREKEDNYFFRLSAFQDDLLELLDEQPDFVMPRHRYNEARSFIESRPAGRVAEPLDVHLGRAGPVGRRARLLRLVRRAAELLHGAVLRRGRARTSPSGSGRRSFTSSARTS